MTTKTAGASRALAALTQAALAIPGVAAAASSLSADYLYSHYQEGDIPASRLQPGTSGQRFEIDSHQARLSAPLGGAIGTLDATYETLSGASPWYVMPGPGGKPLQAMSSASIREERKAVQAGALLPRAPVSTRLSVGYSSENDYRALHGGVEFEYGDRSSRLIWTGGLGYSSDAVDPTQGNFPTGTRHADRDALNLYGGASLVITERTVAQASLNFSRESGYLSDPYKRAWIVDQSNTIADHRPGDRESVAVNAKLRHHLAALDASLHLDYRYFHDGWHVNAHTVEASWHQVVGESWRIVPGLRWYSQSQAYFYAPYFSGQRGDGLATSDYRLSPFGALSFRLEATKEFEALTLGVGGEFYRADVAYALGSVKVANPGLVEFWSLQARLTYRF